MPIALSLGWAVLALAVLALVVLIGRRHR